MDILGKLRVIFWGCVIGIWGLFMYQYISHDLVRAPAIRLAKNPFSGMPPAERGTKRTATPEPDQQPGRASRPVTNMLRPLAAGLDIKRITSGAEMMPEHSVQEKIAAGAGLPADSAPAPQAPPGFAMLETRHFVVYEEGGEVSKELVDTVEKLHGDIMLDLVAFSPWTRDRKVFVFFADSQDTYQRLTGRPAWSGGTASLSERKIYLFKSEEAFGILAHELTHIYFDSFFPAERNSPLWLSEGIATYIQSERGHAAPNWLARNLLVIEKGGGFKLDDLIRIDTMQETDEENVRLWYAQSYSVVRFLMRMKAGEAFYLFCKNLREGMPAHRALYQSYGMPYNKLSALEYAWRYDLKSGKLSGANP
jgi:hypothetical protein